MAVLPEELQMCPGGQGVQSEDPTSPVRLEYVPKLHAGSDPEEVPVGQ